MEVDLAELRPTPVRFAVLPVYALVLPTGRSTGTCIAPPARHVLYTPPIAADAAPTPPAAAADDDANGLLVLRGGSSASAAFRSTCFESSCDDDTDGISCCCDLRRSEFGSERLSLPNGSFVSSEPAADASAPPLFAYIGRP